MVTEYTFRSGAEGVPSISFSGGKKNCDFSRIYKSHTSFKQWLLHVRLLDVFHVFIFHMRWIFTSDFCTWCAPYHVFDMFVIDFFFHKGWTSGVFFFFFPTHCVFITLISARAFYLSSQTNTWYSNSSCLISSDALSSCNDPIFHLGRKFSEFSNNCETGSTLPSHHIASSDIHEEMEASVWFLRNELRVIQYVCERVHIHVSEW